MLDEMSVTKELFYDRYRDTVIGAQISRGKLSAVNNVNVFMVIIMRQQHSKETYFVSKVVCLQLIFFCKFRSQYWVRKTQLKMDKTFMISLF